MYWRIIFLSIFIVSLLGGCATPPPKPVSPPAPVVVKPAPPPVVHHEPPPEPEPVPVPDVAILVSSSIPAYREVAEELQKQIGARAKSWYLDGTREGRDRVITDVASSGRQQVVAIGLDAARSATQLRGKQVVFCQVFNYDDFRINSSSRKGVGVLPSFEKTFAAWKGISPNLHVVAVITGPGVEEYVHQAQAAAKAEGITLVHSVVNSDKEFLLRYKELSDNTQGYWLWPDNRVLSRGVLKEVMTFSVRNGKQVLVFTDDLLGWGGLISATADYRDIAKHVIARLKDAEGKKGVPGPVIDPLDEAKLRINPVMIKRFDITVPQEYRKYLNAH